MTTIIVRVDYLHKIKELSAKKQQGGRTALRLALIEELGELARETAIAEGWKNREYSEDGVIGELIDVYICALSILLFDIAHPQQFKVMNGVYAEKISSTDMLYIHKMLSFPYSEYTETLVNRPLWLFITLGGTQELFDTLMLSKLDKWESQYR